MNYPYQPKGRELLFTAPDNPFIVEASRMARQGCFKQGTGAVVVREGKIIGRGSNAAKKVDRCPRSEQGFQTGEGYDQCRSVCGQQGHAEVMAIKDAYCRTDDLTGADLYLYGHWWCCADCWAVMIRAGIRNVYLVKDARDLFQS